MPPLRAYAILAVLGFLALLIWAGIQPPVPPAQTPAHYERSPDPAVTDCARAFGCIEMMQQLGH